MSVREACSPGIRRRDPCSMRTPSPFIPPVDLCAVFPKPFSGVVGQRAWDQEVSLAIEEEAAAALSLRS